MKLQPIISIDYYYYYCYINAWFVISGWQGLKHQFTYLWLIINDVCLSLICDSL